MESPFTNLIKTPKYSETFMRIRSREVFWVTQWKDGCVYRTRSIGRVVMDMKNVPLRQPNPGYTL